MLVFLLGFGCTRLIHFYDECENDAECAQALGSGATCMANGYCSLNVGSTEDTDIDTGESDTGESIEDEDCTTHRECRAEKGWGSVCNEDGTCSESQVTELPARCVTHPSDAFDNWSAYKNAHIIGAIVDSSLEVPSQQAIEMAANEINEGVQNEQFVTFSCDNRNDLEMTVYQDNLDSVQATQLVSSFLMTELHVPVVIGPGISDKVKIAIESSSGSDSIVISTAGGDGLTELSQNGRIWSSVGDDRHRLQTFIEYINYIESYAYSVILSDRPELLSCTAGPNGAIVSGCDVSDDDNLLAADELQDLLYGLNGPMYESLIFPYDVNYPAASQIWFEYLQYIPTAPVAFVFLSDNINTNIDFVSRVLPSLSLEPYDIDFYFSQYALQSSFIDLAPVNPTYRIRGLGPAFDSNGSLFGTSAMGFSQRFYDATNGMSAVDNPQSVFVYDSMMLAYLAILHSDKAGDKGSGTDVSNMLKTFKSFDDAGSGGNEFFLTPQGVQDSLEMNPDAFRTVGLSGQIRYTVAQDASLPSVVWEIDNEQVSYLYECSNTLSVSQEMALDCSSE